MSRDLTAIVPQGLDEADTIILGRSGEDIIFVLFTPIFGIILLSILGLIGTYGIIAGVVLVTGTAVMLFRWAGPGTSVREFLGAQIHRRKLAAHATAMPQRTDDEDDLSRYLIPDGGRFDGLIEDLTNDPSNIKVWQEEQHTSDFTRIKNVYPQFDAIERADGAYISALEISGTNLFLRSRAEKNQIATEFINALNRLESGIQVFITTDPFDVGQHSEVHAKSGSHEAIKQNPILKELHQDYRESVINDPRIQSTRERKVYAVVSVSPEDVSDLSEDGDQQTQSLFGKLSGLFGGSTDSTFSESELKHRKRALDVLEERRQSVLRRLSAIEGVSAGVAPYEDHLGEIRGHWRAPMQATPVEVPASPIVPPEGMLKDNAGSGLLA